MMQYFDVQGVDEWIVVIGGVEEGLVVDCGQVEVVVIVGDFRYNIGQYMCGIWSIQWVES